MKNIDISWKIAKEITEVAVTHNIEGEPREFTSSIAPIISNAMYNREKEFLQLERFLTIIKLSKHYPEEVMLNMIKILGYELTTKK